MNFGIKWMVWFYVALFGSVVVTYISFEFISVYSVLVTLPIFVVFMKLIEVQK